MRREAQRAIGASETILSLFLITLLVVLIMNLLPGTLLSVRYSQQRMQAEELAQSWIDEQFEKPFSELTPGLNQVRPLRSNGTEYKAELSIATDPESTRILRIRVELRWVFRGKERSLTRERWRTRVPN